MYYVTTFSKRDISNYWEVEGGNIAITFRRKRQQGAMPTITIRRKQRDGKGGYREGTRQTMGPTILGTKGNIREIIRILKIVRECFGDLEKIAEHAHDKDGLGQPYFHIKHHVRATILKDGKGLTFRKYRDPHKNNYLHLGITVRIESPEDAELLIQIFESML